MGGRADGRTASSSRLRAAYHVPAECPTSDSRLPRLRRTDRAVFGLHQLQPMRVGEVRVTAGQRGGGAAGQIELLGGDFASPSPVPPRGPAAPLPILDQRNRGTKFIGLPVNSVLNTPASTGMGFWSINPYVGCEFGCTYCYARDTHRWTMERRGGRPATLPTWEAFEKEILVKTDVAEVLSRTLNPAKLAGHSLVIGTATDPYQPAERQFRLTRGILEVLRSYHGLSIGIITKSSLVTRDLDLLQALSRHHEVTVNISLATADARLARLLELRSPVPAARLRALRRLTEGGIHAGLLVAPIIPGVTDDWAGLARLMEAAKEAGARYVVGSALRLGPAARHRFLPFLTREFPALAERYRRHYAGKDHVSQSYQDALSRRLRLLKQTYGFSVEEAGTRGAGGSRRRQLEGRSPRREAQTHADEQSVLL